MSNSSEHVTDLQRLQKYHCYGDKAALCLEESTTQGGYPTVLLQVAPRLSRSAHTEWSKCVNIQLTYHELPIFAGLLMGYLSTCEFKRQKKGIQIKRQQGSLYFHASQSCSYALPVYPGDAFHLTTLTFSQLEKSAFGVDRTLMLASLRASMSLYKTNS